MQEKHQRPVGDTRQASTEPATLAQMLSLVLDLALDTLPFNAERWIGEHVVEVLPGKPVVGE